LDSCEEALMLKNNKRCKMKHQYDEVSVFKFLAWAFFVLWVVSMIVPILFDEPKELNKSRVSTGMYYAAGFNAGYSVGEYKVKNGKEKEVARILYNNTREYYKWVKVYDPGFIKEDQLYQFVVESGINVEN
jgi:hypothetical protein